MDWKKIIAGMPLIGTRLVNSSGSPYDIPIVGGRVQVDADIVVGDTIELTNTTAAKALASRLVNAAGAAFIEPATQADVQAITAKLTADPATQTTLAAILAKLIAAPATEATLAAVQSLLTPYAPVNSWDNAAGWKDPADPTALDATVGAIPNADFVDGAMRLYYLGVAGQKREVAVFMNADDGAAHDFAYNAFEGYVLPANKTLAGYVSAWPKCVNQLRVTRDQDDGASQIRFTTEAQWVLFSITDKLGAIVKPAVAGQCNVVARRVA